MRLDRADLVIVGAGTLGGWASVFARAAGLERVVVLERGRAGAGASSRAAGMVRAQGGVPVTVALGRWSIDFYRAQPLRQGIDSGFQARGYLIYATTADDESLGRERVAMQQRGGLEVRWLDPMKAAALDPTLDPSAIRGASYAPGDGCIDPPRNVRAYLAAMQRAGVGLREETAFTGLDVEGRRVRGVTTDRGPLKADRVLLAGGPHLRAVGEAAGVPIPVGAVRHQVFVTEPHAAFQEEGHPMGFDLAAGLYWRPEDGGLLYGMSNPDEPPGEAGAIDWQYAERMRERLGKLLPVTRRLLVRKAWAATIDFTPDHLPIVGPALDADGVAIEGVTVVAAGGHGMMWGPAVARAAVDLAVHGRTSVADVSGLGLDRFDAQGRSRLRADPTALPFPTSLASDDQGTPIAARGRSA